MPDSFTVSGSEKILALAQRFAENATLFAQLKAINHGLRRPPKQPHQTIKKIGIIGAGMMGRGIAIVCATNNITVILKDIDDNTALKSQELCLKSLANTPNNSQILQRIQVTANPNALQDCELIIEAVFEEIALKSTVIAAAEGYLAHQGFIASNTSTLPISLLANATTKPEHFIGLHFFSPVEKMPLLEIIVGKKTQLATVAKAFDFAQQIHKIPIVVNDSRGFFTSRVFGTYVDEGARLLEEGVAPEKIEAAAKAAGMAIGPLAVMDEISLKLLITIAETNNFLDQTYGHATAMNGEASLRVAKRLTEKFQRGGRAYSGGFYDYPDKAEKHLWPMLTTLYPTTLALSAQDIQDRLLFRQILEAVNCYHEGIIETVAEANIGSIFGIGFPSQSGGVLQFINEYGLDKFVTRCQQLATAFGSRFTPTEKLILMATQQRLF